MSFNNLLVSILNSDASKTRIRTRDEERSHAEKGDEDHTKTEPNHALEFKLEVFHCPSSNN